MKPVSKEVLRSWSCGFASALLAICISFQAHANSQNNCAWLADTDERVRGEPGSIDRNSVFVLAENTPVLEHPSFDSPVVGSVAFNELVDLRGTVVDVATGNQNVVSYVEVAFGASRRSDTPDIGWIQSQYLLCGTEPALVEGTALERKLFIRTRDAITGELASVATYMHPTNNTCAPDGCIDVTRAELYFVYDETDDYDQTEETGRLLISPRGSLAGQAPLVGWIDAADVMPWNTAIAVRGAEHLGNADEGGETICLYTSLEEAADPDSDPALCEHQAISGGTVWYSRIARLPILREVGDYFELALFTQARALGDETTVAAGPDDNVISGFGREIDGEFADVVEAARFIDVYFVVDGTASMGPAIEAIQGTAQNPGIVQTVIDNLERGLGGESGVTFRFGFQVYRDSIVGDRTRGVARSDGVDEAFRLPDMVCGEHNPIQMEQGRRQFESAFGQVRAQSYPDGLWDDYAENLFGGLQAAAQGMSSCSGQHLKVVVVLGDHGYDPSTQADRGFSPLSVTDVGQRLRVAAGDLGSDLEIPLLQLMFVQMQSEADGLPSARHVSDYNRSYNKFREDAFAILRALNTPEETLGSHFYQLDGTNDAARVSAAVEGLIRQWGQADRLEEMMLRLAAGESPEEILAAQRATDAPVLFLAPFEAVCRNNPEACRDRGIEISREVYVRRSDALQFDVLMTIDGIREFIDMAGPTIRMDLSQDDLRNALTTALRQSILAIAREDGDTAINDFRETLNKRIGFPSGLETPVLGYSLDAVRLAPGCELELLQQWIVHSASALATISRSVRSRDGTEQGFGRTDPEVAPGDRPVLRYPDDQQDDSNPDEDCRLTGPGTDLPRVIDVATEPLGDTGDYQYGYESPLQGFTFFWVPVEYLP